MNKDKSMKFLLPLISNWNEADNLREKVLNAITITIGNYLSNYVTN